MESPPNPGSDLLDEQTRGLCESAAAGDDKAIDQLLELYLPGLEGFVRKHAGRIVTGKESGSDLVQSVCRELLEGMASGKMAYRGKAEFKQWLYQAAQYKILNRHRFYGAEKRDVRREFRPSDQRSGMGGDSIFQAHGTPSQEAIRNEESERAASFLDQLPPRYKEIIVLSHFQGLSHEVIASRLGIEVAHSRVLLSRAIARLAKVGSMDRQSRSEG